MRFGIDMRKRMGYGTMGSMAGFMQKLLPRYVARVLSHTLKDWKPRFWSGMLTVLVLALTTWLQPPAPGAISLDWSKWKATAVAWAIALSVLLVVKIICAQWKVHKEDQEQLVEAKRSDLKIHTAVFSSKDGTSSKPVAETIERKKRDGLIIIASSDALKCDPSPRDDYKVLTVSYSFGDAGPFEASRSQDSPYPLVLPQDRFLLKQIADYKQAIQEIAAHSFAKCEKVGEMLLVASEAERIASRFNDCSADLKKRFPVPLSSDIDRSLEGHGDIEVLQSLYREHAHRTSLAASGSSFDSHVRANSEILEMGWAAIFKALQQNGSMLKAQAASLREEAARPTISATDHR